MTPQQQRIAIAEACGWKPCPCGKEYCQYLLPPRATSYRASRTPPDYLNDLNAMHAAEEYIKDWPKWVKMLAKVIAGVPNATRAEGTKVLVDSPILARATAAQRAEAFLRTLNLWKVEENSSL